MSDWPLDISGEEYHPIPETWIEHGDDHGNDDFAGPRLYAVSVAALGREMLALRYHHPREPVTIRVTMQGVENPTGDGLVPSLLANSHGSWPRSLVPTPEVEPTGDRRELELEHLQELWGSRVDEIPESTEPAIADGGSIWVTSHALSRWNERSDAPHIHPATAWDEGTRILGTDLRAEEIRYHGESRTLLLRKGNSIVTTIDADTASIQTRRAIERVAGGEPA